MPALLHTKAHTALKEAIKTARARAGLSQEDVARSVGRNVKWVSGVETGSRGFQAHEIPRLAKALGMTPEKFFKLWMALLRA